VREVILALRVVGRELSERLEKRLDLETIYARVDFATAQLGGTRVLLFYRPLKLALPVADDSSVARRISHCDAPDGGVVFGVAFMPLYKLHERPGLYERDVAREHHEWSGAFSEGGRRGSHRISGSALLGLHTEDEVGSCTGVL